MECPCEYISAEWERQSGLVLPPFPEIDNALESRILIGELAFMNDQTDIGLSLFHSVEDLVERHDHVLKRLEIQAEG